MNDGISALKVQIRKGDTFHRLIECLEVDLSKAQSLGPLTNTRKLPGRFQYLN